MKDDSNLAYDLEFGSFELREDTLFEQNDMFDDRLLEEMRGLIKGYVQAYLVNSVGEAARVDCKGRFDQLRSQLHDIILKEYSSFEFMEKLYLQEYSAKNAT